MKCQTELEKEKSFLELYFNRYRKHLICQLMRVKKNFTPYTTGQKRCKKCDVYYSIPDSYCPCCGYQLRTKARNKTTTLHDEIRRKKEID
ncbi:MAG: hypothetical protein COA77_02490 [Thaumarchaeota archaeon]|nr:MAG: hypothetical protein COA77_02490 [Nitrososphaerota archaeon]